MTPERWAAVKRVLGTALDLDPGARAGYLANACVDDPPLRTEVESLLAHESGPTFLDRPAIGCAPAIPAASFADMPPPAGPVMEVRPADLPPYTALTVDTRSRRYEIVVVAPFERAVLVTGGSRFPRPTRARLHRQETIAVGEVLRILVDTRVVTTTPVRAIEIFSWDADAAQAASAPAGPSPS